MGMKAITVALLLAATQSNAYSKTITVAVIDTGIDKASSNKLCKFGHKSLVDNSPLTDEHGHGTHIAGLIEANAGKGNYCMVSIKWFKQGMTPSESITNLVDAINHAINIKVDYINISGGGTEYFSAEERAIKRALDQGIKVIAAAGNEASNLDLKCNYFPACYDSRINVVGNIFHHGDFDTQREPSSNYGNYVKTWEY